MDFIKMIQRAIRYVEDHILEPITYEDVAESLYMSSYHFHRTFSLLTGMTVKEYIRNRRLSMAGQEVSMSKTKVIDLAYKYGYTSPESFTKAFSRFHGITPNVARRCGMELKSFNRLHIKIKLEGGSIMDYRIEKREPFKLLAKVQKFRNEVSSEEGNREIPDFWKHCGDTGVIKELKEITGEVDLYGVCSPLSPKSTHFKYGIGVVYSDEEVPEGFEVWEVNPTLWSVFKCIGDTPACIGEMWERIMSEFLPGSEYTLQGDTDFELYPGNDEAGCFCEIWIPVNKES